MASLQMIDPGKLIRQYRVGYPPQHMRDAVIDPGKLPSVGYPPEHMREPLVHEVVVKRNVIIKR